MRRVLRALARATARRRRRGPAAADGVAARPAAVYWRLPGGALLLAGTADAPPDAALAARAYAVPRADGAGWEIFDAAAVVPNPGGGCGRAAWRAPEPAILAHPRQPLHILPGWRPAAPGDAGDGGAAVGSPRA